MWSVPVLNYPHVVGHFVVADEILLIEFTHCNLKQQRAMYMCNYSNAL